MSAPSPYAGTTPVASLGAAEAVVTLVEGQTFAVSGRSGDMRDDLPNGLFVLDTRVLSRWELRVNGHGIEPLAVDLEAPFAARFAARAAPEAGHADAGLVLFRERSIGRGMREVVELTNHGVEPADVVVQLHCDCDFADLFEVKESRVNRRGRHHVDTEATRLRFGHRGDGRERAVHVTFDHEAVVSPGSATWRLRLGPAERWVLRVDVTLEVEGVPVPAELPDPGAVSGPQQRLESWQRNLPSISSDHTGLTETLRRSAADLGALRIFDPEHPDLPILAAGAPWFMTVFGRDSLLTAWMTLLADPGLAHGVLATLARFQGDEVDPATNEEPGKILHEMRFGEAGGLALGGGHVYYGTADATPLFVMLLGELRRWNPDDSLVDELLPHADRALEWIERFGDRDGDGYVEYRRSDERGLVNQGWKDSWDAIRFADGRFAEAPIALAEVQGYVYAAYVARAHFAEEEGDADGAARWGRRAADLRRRFNEDFWLEEQGTFALALDADKRPVDAVCSNAGHCLWTGIAEPDRAAAVADRLLAPDSFSGFGIRTMSSTMAAYNPVSYHNGSVWPHDNAVCIAGLARYGFMEHAHRVLDGQLAAAAQQRGALPELFAGFGTDELSIPAVYPTSCSPQAWAAAAPLLWLRSLLRLEPWATRGQLWLAPDLPPWIGRLHVDGIRIAGRPISVDVEDGRVDVHGVRGLEVVHRARPPLSATVPSGAGG